MKTKAGILSFLAVAAVSGVYAQSIEEDDMYFTAKDRAALNAAQSVARQETFAAPGTRRITESEVSSTINPTDSYSARNVNPEYISGSKVGGNSSGGVQYFSPNYQPTAVNQNLASNCNSCGFNSFNNGFGNPWGFNRFGGRMGIGMGMGMMSPWGFNNFGMMDPWMNPWMDPWMMGNGFYQPGFSMGFGSGWGNGWGNPWNNFYGMNSFYGGWGNQWGWGGGFNSWNNPWVNNRPVVIVEYHRPQSTRSQEIDRYYGNDGIRSRSSNSGSSGGRVASNDNSQQYYNRAWRNDAAPANRGTDTWNNTRSYQQNYNNGWNNNSNWGGRNNGSFNSGGRSSYSPAGGGGGYSGGGSSGGGGSRRGRD
jgi:hypothetical protein